MSTRPLTPAEFSALKSIKEKDKAYDVLWDAWHDKGKRKQAINNQLVEIHEGRRRGTRNSNKADQVISDFIIKYYWDLKHSGTRVTKDVLNEEQARRFNPNHFSDGSVGRWNTALRSIWSSQSWLDHPSQFEIFKEKVWEQHRINIRPRQR